MVRPHLPAGGQINELQVALDRLRELVQAVARDYDGYDPDTNEYMIVERLRAALAPDDLTS